MAKKTGIRLSDLTVKAEDCYDPADYVLVHKDYLEGLRSAIREAHKRINDEWGGDTSTCVCIYCSPQTQSACPYGQKDCPGGELCTCGMPKPSGEKSCS